MEILLMILASSKTCTKGYKRLNFSELKEIGKTCPHYMWPCIHVRF